MSAAALDEERQLGADGAPLDLHVLAIPPDLYERLHAASVASGRTVADEVAAAIRQHLERAGQGAPRRLDEQGR